MQPPVGLWGGRVDGFECGHHRCNANQGWRRAAIYRRCRCVDRGRPEATGGRLPEAGVEALAPERLHHRQDAGQLLLSGADSPGLAGCQDHPRHARPDGFVLFVLLTPVQRHHGVCLRPGHAGALLRTLHDADAPLAPSVAARQHFGFALRGHGGRHRNPGPPGVGVCGPAVGCQLPELSPEHALGEDRQRGPGAQAHLQKLGGALEAFCKALAAFVRTGQALSPCRRCAGLV